METEAPLLTETERHQLLVEWNSTSRKYPRDVCLHQLFEVQVDRSPEATALVFHSEHLTYSELNRRANQVAHYLRKQGVGPEVCVGVFTERSLEMLIGIYGILKAGGAYMPLDPEYPPDRLAFMLQDARVPVLLTQKRLVPQLPEHHARAVCVDADWAIMAQESMDNPSGGATEANVAYGLYTSGSTGRPKGVLNTHRGICNRLLWMQEAYPLTAADRVLHKTPFSFDVSLWELFWPLLVGARLIVAQPGGHRDNAYLVNLIATQGITTLHFVPSMLQLFLEEPDVGRCQSLRRVMCSGEALPHELQARFFARLPTVELHNLYGPTEAAVDVTSWACRPQSKLPVVPIGRPVANTQVYILDPHLQPVPIRMPGELHIGGVQVARGYLHRPELTAEKFIPDPFSTTPGARLYKTGDLARYLPDGTIEFLGRLDHQVKLRGFRIELGEIEAVLGQHPEVRETVVTVREDAPGDKRLVAYVVPHQGRSPTTTALQHFLRDRLPEYMVPAVFVPLHAMPLTPNGKVDRRGLPAPGRNRPELEQAYVAPQTRVEQFLASIWCEVLRLDRVGIDDNFFDLGGDSIQGAMFINKLQQHLQESLFIVALFDAPTVAAFAAFLTANYGDAVARLLGPEAHPRHLPPQGAAAPARERRVDAAMLAQMRQLIVPLVPHAQGEEQPRERNPQVMFILAPPRSGTTLLRVMLAGHPRLFAAAELQLLGFNTLKERRAAFSGKYSLWLEGTIRAVMQIQGCDADQAMSILARYEDQDMTTRQFYRVLQDWVAPQTLVDKSPSYALDIETLKRAECDFKDALYIHLVRHPYAMVRSFERYRMEQVFFLPEHPFSARQLGELVWVVSHQNTVEFLAGVPKERQHRMHFEELTRRPRAVMEQMCQQLGLEYHPDLIEPYKNKEKKMIDGIYAASASMGDKKFNEYQGIEPKVAESWKEVMRDNFLGEVTWEWAERLGYERVGHQADLDQWRPLRARRYAGNGRAVPDDPGSADGEANSAPLSFAQERLWFLDQLTPGTAAYNLPTAMWLQGALNRAALEASLNEIVHRHAVLRTRFVAVDGSPVQMIASGAKLAVTVIDLSTKPEAERAVEVQRLASEEARRPFNLAKGLLVRATLLRLSDQEHVLLLTMHHIASDGWSMGILMRELTALYEAFGRGEPSPLPELPVHYADYAVWQREWLRGAVLERQLQYWKRQLAGASVLELPCDHPRPAVETYRGARTAFSLPRRLCEQLTALSRHEGVTLYMTLLAAFQTLLHRYTGQDDIAVGSPIAGRNRAEFEGLIGFFVNTLVLRVDLAGNPSFRELLGRVREVALAAYAHQELPFEKLVEELQPERSLSHSPLFQVLFILQNAPRSALELAGLTLTPLEVDSGTAKFDLTLCIVEGAEGLRGWVEYNTDLFEAATIARMVGHFQTVLEGIVANPLQRLSDVPLLTAAERQRMLLRWNNTQSTYPQEVSLPALFEAQVARTPEAVAVVFEDQRLTYRELNRRANQLARYLRRRGVGPEVPVGICLERSLEMIIALLGILKGGGAYVPLDPAYPQARLAFMLEDSCAPVLVTQARLVEGLPAHTARVVCLDRDSAAVTQERDEDLVSGPTADHLAYVIYTSGSTGQPKGVQIPHRAVVNFLGSMRQRPGLTAHDVLLAVTTLSFDIAALELFLPLTVGARVVPVSRAVATDGRQLMQALADTEATVMQATPATWRLLLEAGWEGHPALKILCGGEALPRELAEELRQRSASLWNLYGPTETTIWSALAKVEAGHGPVSIGRAIANTQLYVLDRHLQPVPMGVPGELYIGGAGVARGYLHHPELTAEKFVPHPFSQAPGARLYKTGDLARYRPDGALEYLGRLDQQVKLRGFRIELGEIEAALGQHPGVREAVVLMREDLPGDPRLIAYLVSEQARVPSNSDLRRFLQAKLPEYMVPAAFVRLDTLPLTPNGKVDRRALPAPDQSSPGLDDTFVAPRIPVEKALAEIWSDVLGVKQVGIHDNFFALGGHSLLATRVMSRLRRAFRVELPLASIFEAPTVAKLARAIIAAEEGIDSPQTQAIAPRGHVDELPLSLAQQRLWFLAQLEPESSIYNIPAAYRLSGPLNVTALEQSLSEIVRRHETLRTTFAAMDGRPVQVVAPHRPLALPVVDLRGVPDGEREARALQLAAEDAHRPFHLAQGPLFRATLAQLTEETYVLLLNMHHIVSDGWSLGVLSQELTTLYAAFATGNPSPLPELPIQYADFAVWQRQWLQGEVLEKQLSYWKQQLGGSPSMLELPTDRPRPPVQTYRGARHSLLLPKPLSDALKAMSRREGVTLFMTLLAAFQTLLHRYTGQEDILVGSPIAGRTRAELEGLIGFFVNTLILRTDLAGNPTFRELLQRVRGAALGAYAHQDLPFERLVEELQPERSLSHTPLFQVFFNMLNMQGNRLELAGLAVEVLSSPEVESKFDLTLYVREQREHLCFDLVYNDDLFGRTRIVEMLAQLHHLLAQIVESPEERITRFSLVTPEAEALLPNPAEALASDWAGAVHVRFSQQARRVPERLAVVDPHDVWSYAELEARSNQLAHYLCTSGVQPQGVVAIYGHRSASLVWALLGVLKAGAAFLILDPAYPTARLIEYLRVAKPQAWIQIGAAGVLPDILEDFVSTFSWRCRVELPRRTTAEAHGLFREYATEDPGVMVSRDDLAYIVFTSGSTGKPKGILGGHPPLSHFLAWYSQTFGLSETDRFSMLSGLSHDPLLRDILTPLWLGGTLYIPDPEDIRSPGQLSGWMQRQELSIVHLTPAMAQFLTELPSRTTATASSKTVLRSLRYACFGGDVLTTRDVSRVRALAPAVTCVNFYGATETPQAMGYFIITNVEDLVQSNGPTREEARERIPLGRGITDVQLLVLNEAQQSAGIGEVGEVYVRTPYLTKGYIDDEPLTQERFIINPFTNSLDDRLYKTGDLARYRADGSVEFVGRIDDQVKIRGFRIELRAVELVLSQHSALREAVVIVREDTPGEKQLVAYVVANQPPGPSSSDLRRFLQVQLPDYMIPSAFVLLDTLPLTPNGKVNRPALPGPDGGRPELDAAYVAPRTPTEEVVAGIWADILGLEQVGVQDNFFELGGHSLLATQVISRLHGAFQVTIPLRRFFEEATVASLAEAIEQGRENGSEPQASTIAPIPREAYRVSASSPGVAEGRRGTS